MIVLKLLKMKMNILVNIKNRRKHKVIFRLQSNNKKICTVKFNDREFLKIKLAAISADITLEEFFIRIIKDLGKK
jgi:hypothetical protein